MNAELQRLKDLRIANGEVHTNFGWLNEDQVTKGLEWGAVKWGYKDKGVFNVCPDKGNNKRFNTLSCWLAYVERCNKESLWFKHLERRDDFASLELASQFKALTGISVGVAGRPLF